MRSGGGKDLFCFLGTWRGAGRDLRVGRVEGPRGGKGGGEEEW